MNRVVTSLGRVFVLACVIFHINSALAQSAGYVVLERGADYKILQKTTVENCTNCLHRYVELANGMHYKDANGQWQESQELIEPYSGGAVARHGQYQVIFANNLNSYGAIDMQMPDGKRLRSNILGLMYHDTATDDAVLIARLQDSEGSLIASNQVLYPNAFQGLKADVRYTYKRGSFEQDVILREQPPTPESLGMNSATTELEIMSEFINPPVAQVVTNWNQSDADINWGVMQIGAGKAFDLGSMNNDQADVAVQKKYVSIQGRRVLLEKVNIRGIRPALSKLPLQSSIDIKKATMPAKGVLLPVSPQPQSDQKPIKLAMNKPATENGFVLDYIQLTTITNDFTFQSNTTYYISGQVSCNCLITFEEGAVLKFQKSLVVGSSQINNSGSYANMRFPANVIKPALFTAVDDDSVGETISGSTGVPSGYYGKPQIRWNRTSYDVVYAANIRMKYAKQALKLYGNTVAITNVQFTQCYDTIEAQDNQTHVYNSLFKNSAYSAFTFDNSYSTNYCQNTTFDGVYFITINALNGITMSNCVFANVTFLVYQYQPLNVFGGYNGFYNSPTFGSYQVTNTFYPFQMAGMASNYLVNGCVFHDAGTTNIDSDLLAELQTMTTYAPQDGSYLDTDTPDLGYHYPLDEDSDYDGLPDWWEWKYFSDYGQTGADDYNGDGLSNVIEWLQGRNPAVLGAVPDTNGVVNLVVYTPLN